MNAELVQHIAKRMQWVHSKQTKGAGTPWKRLRPEDQKLWVQLARVALKAQTEPLPETPSPALAEPDAELALPGRALARARTPG